AQHRLHALQPGGLGRDGRAVGGEHQEGDFRIRHAARAADALGSAGLELRAVVFGNDQYATHQSTPRFLRAATSSWVSWTMIPFCRGAGGSVRTTWTRAAAATPRSANGRLSSGFFFAFMMSGNLT